MIQIQKEDRKLCIDLEKGIIYYVGHAKDLQAQLTWEDLGVENIEFGQV